jgi:two-component sensor histidine kinase
MPATISNTFIFSNSSQSLVTSLRQILDFISGNLPRHTDAANINFKVKVIIAELLNNALKHAGNTKTSFHIFIDNKNIRIEKADFGNRFNPGTLTTLTADNKGLKVQLSSDALHRLYAFIETETQIRFFCEENENSNMPDINAINEHFGLLIITKSADDFTYQYDQTSGLNTFTVCLKLN